MAWHISELDDYDGPSPPYRMCTCAGPWPGYPQHESFCGRPDVDEDPDEASLREWQDVEENAPEDQPAFDSETE